MIPSAEHGRRDSELSTFMLGTAREISQVIRDRGGICPPDGDPPFRGELAHLFENAGTRVQFCRRAGMKLDAVGECLFESRMVNRPVTIGETLDILELITRPAPKRAPRARVTRPAVDAAIEKARRNRGRKFVCDSCGQIVQGTRRTEILCSRCVPAALETLRADLLRELRNPSQVNAIIAAVRAILPTFTRVSPLPEELLAMAGELSANTEAA